MALALLTLLRLGESLIASKSWLPFLTSVSFEKIGVRGGKAPRDLVLCTQLQRALSPGAFLPITPAPVSDVLGNSRLLDVIHNGLVALRIAEEPITQFNTPPKP